MHRLESRLAEWQRVYKELEQVRQTLANGAFATNGEAQVALQAQARRLQDESDVALASIHEALRSGKAPRTGQAV